MFLTAFRVPIAAVRPFTPGTSHPTIKSPEQGLSVLSRFAADFEPPNAREAYDRIIYLKSSEHASPIYSRSEIAAVMQRLHDAPPPVSAMNDAPICAAQSFQGRQTLRGNFYRGRPPGSHFSSGHESMSRGRGFSAYASLNARRTWRGSRVRKANAHPRTNQSQEDDTSYLTSSTSGLAPSCAVPRVIEGPSRLEPEVKLIPD